MKNLKKILIAVAILALLVTGVVIMAFASSDDNENFERAKFLYSYVESEHSASTKSKELKILYDFVSSSKLNDKVEGFAEFKNLYQSTSVKIGYSLYEEALSVVNDSEVDALEKINFMGQVVSHFKGCPVDASVEGYSELTELVHSQNDKLIRELFDEAVSKETESEKRKLLLEVFAKIAIIPLSEDEWDYHIFSVDYNSESVKSAMALAEIAAGVFAEAEKEALVEYKEALINAIAEMYAAEVKELYILACQASRAFEKKEAAYKAKYEEEMAKPGAVEQDAIAAATAAGIEAYNAAIAEESDVAIEELRDAANKAYDDAIAAGAPKEEAQAEYDKVVYKAAYDAYDSAYAAGIATLEAEAQAAYDAAYAEKLSAIGQAAYDEKYQEVYNAGMAEENPDEDAVKAAADAAGTEAATAKKELPESVEEATRAADEAKAGKIQSIKEAAKAAAQQAFNDIKDSIDSEAEDKYNEEKSTRKEEITDAALEAYSEAYEEAYLENLLAASPSGKAAYDATYAEMQNPDKQTEVYQAAYNAKYEETYAAAIKAVYDAAYDAKYYEEYANGMAGENPDEAAVKAAADAAAKAAAEEAASEQQAIEAAETTADTAAKKVAEEAAIPANAALEAYWAVIKEEAEAASAPVYEAEYESALIVLISSADAKYKKAFNETYSAMIEAAPTEIEAAVAAAKAAGEAAYSKAISDMKAALDGAADDVAYDAIVASAIKVITDAVYDINVADNLISVEYAFTLEARRAYNETYQSVYDAEFAEKSQTLSRAEASTLASAKAKAEAEKAYHNTLKELVAEAIENIAEAAGAEALVAAEAAREAAYNAAIAVAGTSEQDAIAAGENAYIEFYIGKLPTYYEKEAKKLADEQALAIARQIIEKAEATAEKNSASAYNDVLAKYESDAKAAGEAAGDVAYDAAYNEAVSDYCTKYEVDLDDAKDEIDEKAVYLDPINDPNLKPTFSAKSQEFNSFYNGCDIDEYYGSLAADFANLDAVLKEVALTDTRFILVEYFAIPNSPNETYQYPLNKKNSVLSRVQNAINTNGLNSGVPGFVDFYNQFSVAKSEYEELLQAAKDALDKKTDLNEYGWTPDTGYYQYKEDFSKGLVKDVKNMKGTTTAYIGQEGDNNYMVLHWGTDKSYLYFEDTFKYESGLVLNFDFKVSQDFNASVDVTAIGSGTNAIVLTIFIQKTTGTVGVYYHDYNKGERVYVYDIFTPDVWSKLTITYDHNTHMGALYANYEHICDIYYHNRDVDKVIDFEKMRIASQTTNQEVSFDNFHYFSGTSVRDYYKFQNMNEEETFKYYVDCFTDREFSPANRNEAYVRAKGLYTDYVEDSRYDEYTKYFTDPEYSEYYTEEIKKPAIESNMNTLAQMFEDVPDRNSTTIKAVRTAISNIELFILANTDFLDRTSDAYIKQMADLSLIEAEILRAEYIRDFVEALRFFERATTVSSMTKHYNAATAIYALAGYEKADNVNYVKEDPAVTAFAAEFGDPFEYYEEKIVEKMAARQAFENSRKVVDCLYFILDMKVTDADGTIKEYEDTEEFWAANYDFINTYVTVIRKIVSSGNYDNSYTEDVVIDGETVNKPFSYFIERYELINAYFYDILQKEHLDILNAQLDKFKETDSYIQKVGICEYIKRYVAENDIDEDREEFVQIISKVEIYEAELESQKKDYKVLLSQKTQYFVTAVNKMTAFVDYADILPLYNEATSYYYQINVNSDEAKAAIAIYTAYGEKIEAIEENANLFLGYVRQIELALKFKGTRKEDALYTALIDAMGCVEGLDKTYSGVADAYEIYEEQLLAYNAGASAINSDISGIGNVTCAVRTNCISEVVLAVIKKIFSN